MLTATVNNTEISVDVEMEIFMLHLRKRLIE